MNCSKCQSPLPEGKLFCPKCGHLNEKPTDPERSPSPAHSKKSEGWWYLYAVLYVIFAISNFQIAVNAFTPRGLNALSAIQRIAQILFYLSAFFSIGSVIALFFKKPISLGIVYSNLILMPLAYITLLVSFSSQGQQIGLQPIDMILFALPFILSVAWFLYFRKKRHLFSMANG